MHLLIPLASLLGIETEVLLERLKRNAATWLTMVAFGAIAAAFLLVALYNALALQLGPIWAPLSIAAGALLVTGAIYLIMRLREERVRGRSAERRVSSESTALVTTALITALPVLLKSQHIKAMAVPLAGVAAAAFMLLRTGRHPGDTH